MLLSKYVIKLCQKISFRHVYGMPLFENMMKILHLASFYPHSILTERNNNIVGFNQRKWIKRRGGSKDIAKI